MRPHEAFRGFATALFEATKDLITGLCKASRGFAMGLCYRNEGERVNFQRSVFFK